MILLQRDKQREAEETLETEQSETKKWKQKVKEQTDRFKDAFSAMEKMKEKANEDSTTIRRLQSANPVSNSAKSDPDLERRYRDLEKKYGALKQRVEKKSAPGTNNTSPAALKERVEALMLSNEMLREDNRSLLLEMAKSGDGGKFVSKAKLEEKEHEINALKQKLEKSIHESHQLRAQIEELESLFAAEKNDMVAMYTEELDELKQNLTMSRAKCALLESQLGPLRSAVAEGEIAQKNLRELRAQDYGRRIAAAVEERDLWRNRAEELTVVLEKSIETDMKQLAVSDKLRETISYLKGETRRVTREHESAKEKLEQAKETLSTLEPLEEQKRIYLAQTEEMEQRCAAMTRSVEETSKAMEEMVAKEKSLKAESLELLRAKIELETELEEQRILCRDFEDCSKESEDMSATLMAKLDRLELDRRELDARFQILIRENEALLDQKMELTTLSGKLFETSEMRNVELDEKDSEIEALKSESIQFQKSLAEQEQACRALSETLDRKMEDFHRKLAAKREECNTLRKLVDEGNGNREEQKKRINLEFQMQELESSIESERQLLAEATGRLSEAQGEAKRLEIQIALESNCRAQLELAQESMQEVLAGTNSCCCTESEALSQLIRESMQAAEPMVTHAKEMTKLQTIVDQQNRYINESKAKSNKKIRILHSQLVAAKEELGRAAGSKK